VRDAAENSPALLAAMARLYRAYAAAREAGEAGVAAATDRDRDRAETVPGESPVDRIRAIMHEARNYFPELEVAAETFAAELALAGNGLYFALCEHLRARQGIRVRTLPVEVMGDRLRWYDHHRRQLMI
ncbi:MAG: XRE family transcriptional regulator, partial [Methylocella sp.]